MGVTIFNPTTTVNIKNCSPGPADSNGMWKTKGVKIFTGQEWEKIISY
jgi:hypothetical protein